MKTLFALAALGAALVLPAGFAQAQTDYGNSYGATGYSDAYGAHHQGYDGFLFGGGTLENNSNCPAGSSPHVWPNGNGYRCLPN